MKLEFDLIRNTKVKKFGRGYNLSGKMKKITKEIINKLENNEWIDKVVLSREYLLSEKIMRKYQDKLDWNIVSMFQILSEDFIREFQDKVNWFHISHYQKLSESFIKEFQDKIEWVFIRSKKVSESF